MRFILPNQFPTTITEVGENTRETADSLDDGQHEPRFRGMMLRDGITAPTTNSFAQLFVDTSDGDFKILFSDGTLKTIVADT